MLCHIQEGFAFSHCTTCKAPYYLRVHVHMDRKWRTLKFRFFVTRDILFIFALVQFVSLWEYMGHLSLSNNVFYWVLKSISYSAFQVISALAYLVHFIDGYQQYWLRISWGFDNEVSFYYMCGKPLNHLHICYYLYLFLHECSTLNLYAMLLSVCVRWSPILAHTSFCSSLALKCARAVHFRLWNIQSVYILSGQPLLLAKYPCAAMRWNNI